MNRLFYGDCLTVMRDNIKLSSVDLIYLDPSSNSNREYNAIYTDETGRLLPDQIAAFCDLWELDDERERAIRHMPILLRGAGVDDEVAQFWQLRANALRKAQPRLLAYLSYMTERLLPMRGLLKPTDSIYLHCDPAAGHYIKIMMDGIFGHANFRNEIVRKRTSAHNSARRFGPVQVHRLAARPACRPEQVAVAIAMRDMTTAERPAGTYARRISSRLLIDLSWNSSRLEGNAYSLLDTERLIDLGEEAEGKTRREARMILNHKEAIGFPTGAPEEIGFNRYTVLNLHALLAAGLLADPAAAGRLRHIGVGIDGSVFHPLESPQLVEEYFDRFLDAASQIADPFEQSFFAMVHIPYLQPFDDVNKRVSRLSANIPLIRANLSPLSFEDTPRGLYTEALMGVYEMNRVDLLRDVFVWAYERSAARYVAIRQSLGDPDPFRWRNRTALREVVGAAVRGRMDRKRVAAHIDAWAREHVDQEERSRFRDVAERELLTWISHSL